jgi:hypothetical protein
MKKYQLKKQGSNLKEKQIQRLLLKFEMLDTEIKKGS